MATPGFASLAASQFVPQPGLRRKSGGPSLQYQTRHGMADPSNEVRASLGLQPRAPLEAPQSDLRPSLEDRAAEAFEITRAREEGRIAGLAPLREMEANERTQRLALEKQAETDQLTTGISAVMSKAMDLELDDLDVETVEMRLRAGESPAALIKEMLDEVEENRDREREIAETTAKTKAAQDAKDKAFNMRVDGIMGVIKAQQPGMDDEAARKMAEREAKAGHDGKSFESKITRAKTTKETNRRLTAAEKRSDATEKRLLEKHEADLKKAKQPRKPRPVADVISSTEFDEFFPVANAVREANPSLSGDALITKIGESQQFESMVKFHGLTEEQEAALLERLAAK